MFFFAVHLTWLGMRMPCIAGYDIGRLTEVYDVGDLHIAPDRVERVSDEALVRGPVLKQAEEKKDISCSCFLTQQMSRGGSALSKGRKPIFRQIAVKFRPNIRIKVAETAVDRKIVQPEFAIPAAAVAIQMIRVQFRDRERKHRSVRQNRTWMSAELRIEAFSA